MWSFSFVLRLIGKILKSLIINIDFTDSFDPKADIHIVNVNQRINDMLFIVFIE